MFQVGARVAGGEREGVAERKLVLLWEVLESRQRQELDVDMDVVYRLFLDAEWRAWDEEVLQCLVHMPGHEAVDAYEEQFLLDEQHHHPGWGQL